MTNSRAIRLAVLLAAAVLAGVLATSAVAASRSETSAQALNRGVFQAINAFRRAHHLHVLRASPRLASSAREHSFQMGADGYFAHPSANGTAFWRRIEHYYPSTNYGYWSVGENLLWSSPRITAAAAMKLWIASPEHLRNLLTPEWRNLGVSAVSVQHAHGVYHGLNVVIITTDFGVRR